MNDLYNITIQHPTTGQEYHYDPDQDVFYRRYAESTTSKYAWILVAVLLAIVAVCLEYR